MNKNFIQSTNPGNDFLQILFNDGLIESNPKEGELLFNQSSWQRWGKKLVYRWKGTQKIIGGRVFSIGTFMNMKNQDNKITLKSFDGDNFNMSVKKWNEIKPSFEKEEKKDLKIFFKEVMEELKDARDSHPYLLKKKISSEKGMKVNDFGELCIPMHNINDLNSIIGIQKINDKGKKLNYPNSKLGVFFIGEPTRRVFVSEGISDAVVIHHLTGCQTICCFGIYNMEKVVNQLAKKNDKIQYVVCADRISQDQIEKKDLNNHLFYEKQYLYKFKDNMNILVLFPSEEILTGENPIKDFNDLYLKDPRRCEYLLKEVGNVPYIKLLGCKNNSIYIYSSINKVIHILKESSKSSIYLIADDKYWFRKYMTYKEKEIVNKLFKSSAKIVYDESKIRCAGVFQDNGNIVINTGERIIGNPSDSYIYLLSGSFPEIKDVKEFDRQFWVELENNLFPHIAFENRWEIYILFAFMALSSISRIIPFRFSLDLEGESSTGKTYIIENIIEPFFSKLGTTMQIVSSMDTKPVIREIMEASSLVVFEEAEAGSDNKESVFSMFSDIIRQISTKPAVIKRKASSSNNDWKTNEIGCNVLKAYNVGEQSILADINRTIVLRLRHSSEKSSNFLQAMHLLSKDKLSEMGFSMCGTLINRWEDFMSIYKELSLNNKYKEEVKTPYHKFKIYMQILSVLKFLEMISIEEEQDFINYIKQETLLSNPESEDEQILEYIFSANIWIDSHNYNVKNFILSYSREEDSFIQKLMDKFESQSGISLGLHEGIPVIRFKNNSSFLQEVLFKKNKRYAYKYNSVLANIGYRIRYKLKTMRSVVRGVGIPLSDVFDDKTSSDLFVKIKRKNSI